MIVGDACECDSFRCLDINDPSDTVVCSGEWAPFFLLCILYNYVVYVDMCCALSDFNTIFASHDIT